MENIKEYIIKQRGISSKNKNSILGLATGLNYLDMRTSGYKNKELNLIASRVGYGKTSLALTSVVLNLNNNNGVLYFSMDLSKEELLTRIISMKSGIYLPMLKRGIIDEDKKDDFDRVIEELSEQRLFIDDTKYCEINYIKNKSKEMVENEDNTIKMIVIDYFDLIENKDNQNIARELKKLAIELDIPIIVLSQLSNTIEKRINQKPLLSDIKDDTLEIEADTILLIYVNDYAIENREETKELESMIRGDKPEYKSSYIDKPVVSLEIIIAKQLNGLLGFNVICDLKKETSLIFKINKGIQAKIDPQFTKMPKEAGDFRYGYKYLIGLPYNKEEHKNIHVLDAYELELKKIPSEVMELKKLEILRIQNNKIKYIPKDILKLENLEALCLCNNKLEILPNNLIELKKLNELAICRNKNLSTLPDNFSELKLTALSIDGDLLNKYIDMIAKITTLKELDIYGGQLSKKVLKTLSKFPELEELNFESIKNTKFPKNTGVFKKLKYLTIKESFQFKSYNNNLYSDIFTNNIIFIKINENHLLDKDTFKDTKIPDIF